MPEVEPLERKRLPSPQGRCPAGYARPGCPDTLVRQTNRLALIKALPSVVHRFCSTDRTEDAFPRLSELLKQANADRARADNADIVIIRTALELFKSLNHGTRPLISAMTKSSINQRRSGRLR